MESYSKCEMLILNLNYTCHVIPYLGYISDAAEIFRRLCKRTREFWNENLETISCVILSDSNDKLFLEFDCNFSMEKAKYLLGYKTYMLYNLDIRLESKKAYDAALFFLKKVGKVPNNLFSNVECSVTKKTVKDYNQFIKLYLDKGFLPENVDVDIDEFLDSYEDTPQYKKLPKLEFLSEVSFPFNRVAPFKITDMFEIDEERIELSNLDEIYFQFRCLSISLLNARTIYDFGYKFKDELTECCKEINFVFDNFSNEYLIETIKKIVAYFIKQFPLVTKISVEGEHLNLSKFFSLTQHIKEIDEENKIEISFDKPKDVSDQLNSDNEDDEDDLIYNNYSEIELANVEFGYYEKQDKKLFMATAKKFKIAFYNDQWIQIGNFIYIFNFYEFDIGKIFLSDNKNLREKIEKYEDIEEFKNKNFDSFIIIQLSVKFIPTLLSSWRYENILDYQGFKVDLILDDQPCLEDLNDELEQIDDKVLIDISFMCQVDFDSIEGQRFLSIIENKRLGRLIANEHKHSQQSVLALLRFLKLPNNKMNALEIKVGETALIPMIFDSLENNLFIEYLEILSKAKVDDETELKAIEFIGKRIGCVIVLNSNNKLIRPMNQRQVHKYY